MRFIKWLAWLIVALFILLPSTAGFLIYTETGSRWLVQRGLDYVDAPVTFETIEGNLASGLSFTHLKVSTETQQVRIAKVTFAWQPWDLFENKLTVNTLTASGVDIDSQSRTTVDSNANEPIVIPTIDMPIALSIQQFRVDDIAIRNPSVTVNRVAGQINWQGTDLAVRQLEVVVPQGRVTGQATLTTTAALQHQVNLDWAVTAEQVRPELASYGEIAGTAEAQGNIDTTQVAGHFVTAAEEPEQKFNLELNNLLSELTWSARLSLDAFRTSPILAFVPDANREQANYYLGQSRLSGVLETYANGIRLQDGELTDISPTQGTLRLNARIDSLFDTDSSSLKPFSVTLTGRDITIANEQFADPQLAQLTGTVEGQFDTATGSEQTNYQFDVSSTLTGINNESAQIVLIGEGNVASANLEIFTIDHPQLLAQGSSAVAWSPEFRVEAELTQLKGSLQQQDVDANGYLFFDGDTIEIRDTRGTWAGIEFNANGKVPLSTEATPISSPLQLELRIADFTRVQNVLQPESTIPVEGSLELTVGVQQPRDGRVPVVIRTFKFDNPDIGEWLLTKEAEFAVELDSYILSTSGPICLNRTNPRRRVDSEPASLCTELKVSDDNYQLSVNARDLPLFLLNRLREQDVSERIVGRANVEANFELATDNFKIIQTSGSIYSDSTFFVALDDELTTRLEIWDVDWEGSATEIRTDYIIKLEDDLGQLIGDLSISDIVDDPQLSGSVDMSLRDLSLLQWWLPDLRYREPFALGSIAISGSATAPKVEGSLEIAAKEIGFAESGLVLTNVKVLVADDGTGQSNLELNGQAESGQGWIAIGGTMNPLDKVLNMTIKGDDFRVVQLPHATVDIDPDLTIQAADSSIRITGSVNIPYAYLEETDISTSVSPSRDVVLYQDGEQVESIEEQLYQVFADVRVTLGDNVKVSAFGFEGRLDGNLRLIEEPGRALTASGTIQVPQGQYVLYGQELDIQRGRLIYNGGPIDNPGLDLRVVRTSASMTPGEEVTVGAQVGGTLIQPDFRLFSNPAMPESSILSYLVLGRGPGAGSGNENMQLQALLLLGSQGTDAIGSQLQNVFGFDEFGLDSSSDPTETSFYIGKYLSPRLYVKYGVGLFENTNTFFVRYKLTERLLLESTASSIAQGGDIFYTFEK
ncbi:translocation/assembly module TamB domain-containing protein [Pseudidiomarina aestuarii]|uniref:translocation/assembly module TamB domain-containing protein n=1 Tax=Pseudidiomarina aestuarii TaxID=624146 RepID=UPI003A97B6B1